MRAPLSPETPPASRLEDVLTEIGRRLAREVLEALADASFAELAEVNRRAFELAPRRRRSARRPRKQKTRKTPATVLREALVARLREAGAEGVLSADLRAALGAPRAHFRYAARVALAAGAIRKTGESGDTRFFVT